LAIHLSTQHITQTTLAKEEIVDNIRSVLCSFRLSTEDKELDLFLLYCVPKLHKFLTNTVILLGLSNENLFNEWSKLDLRVTMILATPGWCESVVDSRKLYGSDMISIL